MDFLTKTFAQMTEQFRAMPPGLRWTTGGLFLVIVLSIVALVRLQNGGPGDLFMGGEEFTPREITSLTAAFSQAQLDGWQIEGSRLRIPNGKQSAYMAAAADGDALPDDFDKVLERIINKSGPFESRQLRDMKWKWAKQRELALVVASFDGVEKAKVTFEETPKGGLSRATTKRALVAVRGDGNRHLTEEQIRSIKSTVAAGIAGNNSDVTVTDLNAGISYPGSNADGSPALNENIYASHQRIFERNLEEKIHRTLSMVPGVVVGVNVELNPERSHSTNRQNFTQPQTLASEERVKEKTSRTMAPGGRAGAVANGVANSPASVASTSEANTTTDSETYNRQHSVVSTEVTDIDKVPLVPTRVTAAIRVPRSYFQRVWKKEQTPDADGKVPDPTPADLTAVEIKVIDDIKDAVVALLPSRPPGEDPYPQVTVTTYTETIEDTLVEPSVAEAATSWLADNWQTLAMLGVAVFSLLMVRSMVKSGVPPADPQLDLATPDVPPEDVADEEDSEEQERENSLKNRFQSSGPNLRDELAELVKEDPDSAAAVLSSWIGDLS